MFQKVSPWPSREANHLSAPFWGWLLLGETASVGTFTCGAVLLVAILFNAYSGDRRAVMA